MKLTWKTQTLLTNGPWASYQIRKIAGAHAPGMPGKFSPPPRVSDPGMHHGTCVTHVPWCMPGSLTNDFLWSRRRGKRSRHSRRMRKPQFYLSGKRPMQSVRATARMVLRQLRQSLYIMMTYPSIKIVLSIQCINVKWNNAVFCFKSISISNITSSVD